jgi:NADH-quinone oxidoreductase subunit D
VNVGAYSYKTATTYGLTGVMSRCTGLRRDLRLDFAETYASYYYLNFRSYIGHNGDSYDRFLLRLSEMAESLLIVNQTITSLTVAETCSSAANRLTPRYSKRHTNRQEYNSMEGLIKHFKGWSEGFPIAAG